jgi:hypothetical protein
MMLYLLADSFVHLCFRLLIRLLICIGNDHNLLQNSAVLYVSVTSIPFTESATRRRVRAHGSKTITTEEALELDVANQVTSFATHVKT